MDLKTGQDDESVKNYLELRSHLEKTLKKLRQTSDLRESKGMLIEVQNTFKGLKLQRENREELYGRLQEAFAEINRKIEEERAEFENQARKNYADYKIRIEEARFLAAHPKDFHETWNHLLEVQSAFKGTRFLREHREELYLGLQAAFDILKKKQSEEKSVEQAASSQNYESLRGGVDALHAKATNAPDLREYKDELIRFQAVIRESKLVREHRDELLGKIQDAFVIIQIRQEEESRILREEAGFTFASLQPRVLELSEQAEQSGEFHTVRESIKSLQAEVRNSRLLKEQREELYVVLQDAFSKLGARQDSEQDSFQKQAKANYERLRLLVEEGVKLAEETSKYKESREFLKKIQTEFKEIKLLRDQREELYSRLQTAFRILNKRVDEFFREKKKNWMVKMQYKFSESSGEIFILQKSLEKDEAYLKELEDQLEIVTFSRKEPEVIAGLESRIFSIRKAISRKMQEIAGLEKKMEELHDRLEPHDDQD